MVPHGKLPLEGIRVLELGHTVMGPTAGLVLADMGADVYKVERTGKGDDTRWLKGFGAGFFTYFNRNKKSISIDLKSDRGREILLKLIEKAGIPFAPVARPQDLFDDPQLNQSGSLATTRVPGGGVTKLPKIPLRMDHLPFDLRLDPPGIGKGSLGLYRACGFSDAEIRELVKEGVVELPREEWSRELSALASHG